MDEQTIRRLLEDVRKGDDAMRALIALGALPKGNRMTQDAVYRAKPPEGWGNKLHSEKHPQSIPERVVEHFKTFPADKLLGIDALHKRFPKVLRRSILSTLSQLVERGELDRAGKGFYRLPKALPAPKK